MSFFTIIVLGDSRQKRRGDDNASGVKPIFLSGEEGSHELEAK